MATSCCGQFPVWVRHAVKGSGRYCNREGHLLPQQTCFRVHIGHISQDTRTESIPDEKCAELLATCVKCRGSLPAVGLDIISQGLFTISAACIKLPRFLVQCLAGASLKIRNTEHGSSLVNQTVFRERACASERGRGGRENFPSSPPPFARACAFTEYGLVHETSMAVGGREATPLSFRAGY